MKPCLVIAILSPRLVPTEWSIDAGFFTSQGDLPIPVAIPANPLRIHIAFTLTAAAQISQPTAWSLWILGR